MKNTVIEYNGNGVSTPSYLSEFSGFFAEDNVITRNSGHGFSFTCESVHSVEINLNEISYNNGNAIYFYSSPAWNLASFFNISIRNNMIFSNQGGGVQISGGGVWGNSYAHDIELSRNNILSNGGTGIYIACSSPTERGYVYNIDVTQNNVSVNSGHGIMLHSNGYYAYLHDVQISGNVLHSNDGRGISVSANNDNYDSWLYNVEIFDNMIFSNLEHGIYLYSAPHSDSYLFNTSVSENMISLNDYGVYVRGTSHHPSVQYDLLISKNTISSNDYGIYISKYQLISNVTKNSIPYNTYGIFYDSAPNTAHYNDIYSNQYGMHVSSGTVNAEHNYWGDSTGPYHDSLNPEGEGNSVNGDGTNLDFIPFLTSSFRSINKRPEALLDVDKTNPNVNETVTFDGSASTDDGRIDYYFFDFGDGTNSSWTPLSVVTHKYASEDTFNATLIVMDDFGVTSLDGDLVYTEITVVPEFPSFIILPLFMIATLLAVIVYRRKHPMKHQLIS